MNRPKIEYPSPPWAIGLYSFSLSLRDQVGPVEVEPPAEEQLVPAGGHGGRDLLAAWSASIATTPMMTAATTISANWIRSFITTLYMPPTTQ